MSKRFLIAILAVLGVLSLAACENTIRGIDKDIADSSDAISDSTG